MSEETTETANGTRKRYTISAATRAKLRTEFGRDNNGNSPDSSGGSSETDNIPYSGDNSSGGIEGSSEVNSGNTTESGNSGNGLEYDSQPVDRRFDFGGGNDPGEDSGDPEPTAGIDGEQPKRGRGRPRKVETGTNGNASASVGSAGRGRPSKKNTVDADTASIVIQLFFAFLAMSLGSHWARSPEEVKVAAEPLARMLSKMPAKVGAGLNEYLDPILFVYGMFILCREPLQIEVEKLNQRKRQNVSANAYRPTDHNPQQQQPPPERNDRPNIENPFGF